MLFMLFILILKLWLRIFVAELSELNTFKREIRRFILNDCLEFR